MRAITALIAFVAPAMLCACSEIPNEYPLNAVKVASDDHSIGTYQAIELAPDNILGPDSPYPTHMVGPLLVVNSPKGMKYCGLGIPRGYLVQIPLCFSTKELQEMHVDPYRFVRVARAEPRHLVLVASAEPNHVEQ